MKGAQSCSFVCCGFCAEVAWGCAAFPHWKGDVCGWDSPAPTHRSQASCKIGLREKEGKSRVTKKETSQIPGKGRG